MEHVLFTSFDGVEVLLIDMEGRAGPDILATFSHASEIIQSQPADSVRTLINALSLDEVQRLVLDRTTARSMKSLIEANQPFVRARAIVVGNDEAKRVIAEFMARASDRPFGIFTKMEEAVAWLVAQ